jgi:hypothetical protein
VTVFTHQPGLIANLAGVAGGDIGSGACAGEVYKMNTDAAGVTEGVAFYHFTGPAHSLPVLVHFLQSGFRPLASDFFGPVRRCFTGGHWGRCFITNGANRP